jgi:hypothetical protein
MPRTAIGAFYAMMRASYWKRASRNSASTRPAVTDDARHFPRMPTRWSLGPKVALFGHAAISELSLLSGVKRKLDLEPAKGSFWR